MNMRKIVAIMAAVLMLFSVIPMGALTVAAAPGDVVLDINFDDGSNGGFERSYNENGYIVFDASTADWQNTYAYKSGFQTNVDYVVTFKAKASKDTTMNFKINDNWGPDAAAFTVNVTTEWQDFEGVINMASLSSAIVMFSSNSPAADAAIYYIDDLKIVEKKEELEVGVVTNGNFENGSEGWVLDSSASIENGALKLENSNQWAEAAMQTIAVEVGTEYTLSWKSQRVSGNGAYMMFILKGDNSNHPAVGQNWMNETSGNWVEQALVFTAEEDTLKIKVSNQDANGVILIDDIKLTATPKVEVGKVTNGGFETGDLAGWTKWGSTDISADAAHSGSYGVNIIGNGGWGGMLDQHINIEDGKTYEFSFWYKVVSSGFNWSLKGDATGTKYGEGWMTTGEWTQVTKTFVANGDTSVFLNFNGGNTGVTESAYIDDVMIKELKDPSFDGYIHNGDFETGSVTPWNIYQSTKIATEAAHTGDYGVHIVGVGNWGGLLEQEISGLTVGKTYSFTFWMKVNHQGVNVKIGDSYVGWFKNVADWTQVTHEFTATATTAKLLINGGGDGNANPDLAADIYVDDFALKQIIDPSYDGYIYNGDFETGEVFPWDNLWGSCPTVEIVDGKDGYGLHIVSGEWNHVRQTNIAVTPNTWYKVTAWAKNASGMSLLVKDGGDSKDIVNAGVSAGDEWTEFTAVFNTGDYTTIIFSLMGNQAEAYGIFDNIKMEITEAPCEHNYELTGGEFPTCETEGTAIYTCSACGDSYTETLPAYHNGGMEYNPAKEAIDCANPGNIENYYCPGCNEYFADAYAQEIINPWYIQVTVECVKPEGLADCAGWTCETCGNENFGSGEHDVLVCQGGTCSKCNAVIEGAGCANYDTPACQDGVCYYCGGFVAGFGHENGAWAPCCEGECSYGCGLTYPATEDHVDADADDYCDNCWNHLACIDEDGDGFCDVCWTEMPVEPPVEILYGDANGDGNVNNMDVAQLQKYTAGWDVTLDMAASDVNGDGNVNNFDLAQLQKYAAGWDVVLGPV